MTSTARGLAAATAAAWLAFAPWPGLPVAAAAETGRPVVAWHLVRTPTAGPSQAIGGYAHGCLAGGVALPLDGIGYQVIRPGRLRYFGHPVLIDYIQRLGRRAEAAGLGLLDIGDMAQPRGGPLNYGHASHQIGLDVDIWLRLDLPHLPRDHRDDVKEVSMVDPVSRTIVRPAWSTAQAELIRLAARDPRVARIFVNPVIKTELCRQAWPDRDWLRLIRPWYGHDDHIHVRLSCPADSPLCESQKPVPPGDGCDSELASWLLEPPPPPRPAAAPPPNPSLPAACHQVNLSALPSAGLFP